jgi:hypothetical protein
LLAPSSVPVAILAAGGFRPDPSGLVDGINLATLVTATTAPRCAGLVVIIFIF